MRHRAPWRGPTRPNPPVSAEPPASAAPTAATALPTYPTRIPPSASLTYALQRGNVIGVVILRWHVAGDRYRLQLQATMSQGRPIDPKAKAASMPQAWRRCDWPIVATVATCRPPTFSENAG